MTLTRADVQRLLEWWGVVRSWDSDTAGDYDLVERLQLEEQRAYERERTR